MGALDNGFRLKPETQPADGDVLVYDAATDSMRAGGSVPGAPGVTKIAPYAVANGVVAAGTSSAEINSALRVQVTVPASGIIYVEFSTWVVKPASAGGASNSLFWTPRVVLVSNGSVITAPAVLAAFVAGTGDPLRQGWERIPRVISGLPSGALVEVQWYQNATATGYDIRPNSSDGRAAILQVTTL